MDTERRFFLKKLAGGSAGVLFSSISLGSTFSLLPGYNKERGVKNNNNIIFPFFKYLDKYNIGDFIPKDQGGKFIQMEIMKTEDDEKIIQKIRNGIFEDVYGTPIGWGRFEESEVEKSVWLNRFYYLPSFARLYFLSGDVSYLDDMMALISRWVEENPRLPESHIKTYNWRDMQVAWRAIHLSWCYYLTEKGLSNEQKELILNSLREHTTILLSGFGKQKLNEFNHQSHGALAMLYLGILFPSLEEADELKQTALKILSHHLEKAFYSDGGNVEQMFGYYPFETHIFRDTYLLCSSNNLEVPASLLPMLEKMAQFLSLTAQPDGTMPPVNDSYEMSTIPTIATLNEIIDNPVNIKAETSKYFPDARIAVIRGNRLNNSWYVLANASKDIGSHSHAGRLGITVWHNEKPILIDSGCCNYDHPDLVKWFRTTQAHNTVIIDGKSDKETSSDRLWVPRRETDNQIVDWTEDSQYTLCGMVSPANEATNSSVLWKRNLALVKNQFLVLHDMFVSPDEHTYELLFHFPPIQVSARQENKTIRVFKEEPLAMIPADSKIIDELTMTEGLVSIEGESKPAPIATFKLHGKGTVHSLIFFIPQNDEFSSVNIEQEENSNGIGTTITKQNGEKTILLMRNPEAKELNIFGHKTNKLFDVL